MSPDIAPHGATSSSLDAVQRRRHSAAMNAKATPAEGESALRPGEVAVEMPAHTDAGVYFIGVIRTPWHSRRECPKRGSLDGPLCTIVVDDRWRAALTGLAGLQRLQVLYWMDRARRDLVLQAPHHYTERRGTFALRSPVRPNPIAGSVARLLRVEGNELSVVGLDCLDNTPLLDIKPYFASTDSVPDASVGWHARISR